MWPQFESAGAWGRFMSPRFRFVSPPVSDFGPPVPGWGAGARMRRGLGRTGGWKLWVEEGRLCIVWREKLNLTLVLNWARLETVSSVA